MNDIQFAADPEKIRLFADDTGIFLSHKNLNQLIVDSEQFLIRLYNWFQDNKLTLNHKKSYFSIFHSKKRTIPRDLTFIEIPEIGVKIDRSNSVKYIGLILDEKLNFKDHTAAVIKSVTKFFGIFKNIKENISFKLARQLYFAFIYSRLKYGIEVYGSCSKTQMNKLQIVQNRLMKFLFRKPRMTSTNELHHEIKILKLNDLHDFSILQLVHNCLNKKCPLTFAEYFKKKASGHNTRQAKKLTIPGARLSGGQSRVQYKGVKLWNTTDDSIVSIKNINSFKKALTNRYITQYQT